MLTRIALLMEHIFEVIKVNVHNGKNQVDTSCDSKGALSLGLSLQEFGILPLRHVLLLL